VGGCPTCPRTWGGQRVRHDALTAWGAAARKGCAALVQLSHPGRQTNRFICGQPLAPSEGPPVKVMASFSRPRAMTPLEVEAAVERFAFAADACRRAGFDGVQIHAAHGYRLAQFLSSLTNRRRLHARGEDQLGRLPGGRLLRGGLARGRPLAGRGGHRPSRDLRGVTRLPLMVTGASGPPRRWRRRWGRMRSAVRPLLVKGDDAVDHRAEPALVDPALPPPRWRIGGGQASAKCGTTPPIRPGQGTMIRGSSGAHFSAVTLKS